jgi:type I restriction-modification system DNA methylase subunit
MPSKTSTSLARQLSFPDMCPVSEAVQMQASAGIEERGAIFTRREVVDFILDLTGYTVDRPLHTRRLLEPSFGDGDFLLPVIDRLVASAKRAGVGQLYPALAGAICAIELHDTTCGSTREKVIARLLTAGLPPVEAEKLVAQWLRCGDFLLMDFGEGFDFAVGNPPYVRQELIPDALITEYRARYATIFDRADLYVPFIEHSLNLLRPGGHLGFICADRWTKNRYGGPLRKLVASSFQLKIYVDMVDTPAFHSDVIAYPAIAIIARDKGTKESSEELWTHVAQRLSLLGQRQLNETGSRYLF